MNRTRIFSPTITALTVAGVAFAAPDAYAYIDPGTGSYMLQLLIAALLGASFTIKTFWGRMKAFLTKRFAREANKGSKHD